MKKQIFILVSVVMAIHAISQPTADLYFASSRLDYYTTEKSGEILVFVPDIKKDLRISIDLVFEYQVLTRNFQVSSHGISTVPFPMQLLREGDNEITVSFYENEKWTDSRKIWVKIMPAKENAVKIDRASGGLVVDDLPFIPAGFFTCTPVDPLMLDEEASRGFNMISPYPEGANEKLKLRKAYMDRCADLGIKVNLNVCMANGDNAPGQSDSRELSVASKMDRLKKQIEMFRDHPALLSWFIADEPDGKNLPADSLAGIYRLIKELDPYHPVSFLIRSPRNAAQYRDVTDILMTDPSPVPQGKITEVKEYVEITRKSGWLEKPVWVVPQTQGGNEWWQREPTADEMRAMTYVAIVHGASGIQYSMRSGLNSFPKSASAWAECGSIAMEINELVPFLFSPHPAPELIIDQAGIHARAYNKSGQVVIMVVNEKNEPMEFSLKMKDVDITIQSDVWFENRKLVIVDGTIKDFIDGYGTRIYHFDARNNPDQFKSEFTRGNISLDGGFEEVSSPGVPSACFALPGYDRGSNYFTDSRRSFKGEHSVRMNNPCDKPGSSLSFFGLALDEKRSYTLSVMASTGGSSNKPAGRNDTIVAFRLGLGSADETFNCSGSWQKYKINNIRIIQNPEGSERISPLLQMTGKGTLWFDNLEVYPDMELVERKGEGEKRNIELKSAHNEVKIFYTLDGSEPAVSSQPYLIPFEVAGPVKIKAAAFTGEKQVGYIEN